MASITYWSQLSPSPRTPSIADGLAARVRDPAWLLARQWHSASSKAPTRARRRSCASARTRRRSSRDSRRRDRAARADQLARAVVQPSRSRPTSATRGRARPDASRRCCAERRRRCATSSAPPTRSRRRGRRCRCRRRPLLAVCAGRASTVPRSYQAAKAAGQYPLPPQPALDRRRAAPGARRSPRSSPGSRDVGQHRLPTSRPRGTRRASTTRPASPARPPAGCSRRGDPRRATADLDWYSFDLAAARRGHRQRATPATTSVIPGHVRFRGMPNARWWDFEVAARPTSAPSSPTGATSPKLLFTDFLCCTATTGISRRSTSPQASLCWIDSLTVTDVFGDHTSIARADAQHATGWTDVLDHRRDSRRLRAVPRSCRRARRRARMTSAPLEDVHLCATRPPTWRGPSSTSSRAPPARRCPRRCRRR